MKKIILGIIIFFGALEGFGQKIDLNANIGYGTYQLKDLKNFQKDMISSTAINDESVESFPNYLNYNFSIDYAFNMLHMAGIELSYYSTGGRNHVADYSGEYSLDMITSAYAFAAHYKATIISLKKMKFYFKYKTGLLFSSINITEKLDVYNFNSSVKDYNYKGYSLVSEPSMVISYSVFKTISLNFNLGFEICSNGRLLKNETLESDDSDELISLMNGNTANWTGLRTSVGITYSLGKKNKTSH